MSTLQRLAAISDARANLIAQLRELNELREQVRKAEQAQRSLRLEPRSQNCGPKIAADKSKENNLLKGDASVSATADRYNQLCR